MKDNPIVFLTKRTWEYSKGNRKAVVLFLFLFMVANAINLAEPLIIASLLNVIQEQGVTDDSLPTITLLLGGLVLLTIGFWAFHGPARLIETKNAFLVRANYKKYLLDGTMGLPARWHAEHHSGDTIDKIEKGTSALFKYSAEMFLITESLILLIGSYLALAYFNLHSSYIVLFMVIFTIALMLKFDSILIPQYKKLNWAENRISAKIFDIISNITTVIVLRIEKLVSKAMVKKIMAPFPLFLRHQKVHEGKWFVASLNGSIMMFLVVFSYVFFSLKGNTIILIGTVYALIGYIQRINNQFFRFAYMYGDIVRQKTAVLNAEEISKEFTSKKMVASHLGLSWKELKIRSLHFSYHTKEGEELHLNNVSLFIKRSQRVAFIGESGSGKTTTLKIIRELYQPQYVDLSVDGKMLRGFRSISADIALIPQDPEIFSATIRENITMGVHHKLDYIKKFTDMVCFTSVVNRLPKKFNSSIVEKGVNLSTGEKQRLALARGLMASEDKSIILLDEPTSSVDFRNELTIYKNIFKNFKDKTIISSIHRLHLLPLFDVIYFFKSGEVIASGSFEQLKKTSLEFMKLWDKYNRTKTV